MADNKCDKKISIIICSQYSEISKTLYENISNTIGVDFEIIHIYNENNRYSIFEAYNMGVEQANGDILCFQHCDIEYLSKNWGDAVIDMLSTPIVGACAVAGANYMRKTPSYYPIGDGYNLINLLQKTDNGYVEWNDFTTPRQMVVFDGLWFCIKKECFIKIHFDDILYKGFHFYDIDISTQLINAGYKIMGIPNVRILHKSGGCTDRVWLRNSFLYAQKWKGILPLSCKIIDDKTSCYLEYRALYSSLSNIIHKKQFKLLIRWFSFAMDVVKAGPIVSLYIVLKYNKL